MVRLEFTIDLDYEISGNAVFTLAMAAARTAQQHVVKERLDIGGADDIAWTQDPGTATRLVRFATAEPKLHVAYAATVDIDTHFAPTRDVVARDLIDIPAEVLPYLAASRYCQSDRLVDFAHAEFGRTEPGYARADAIARWVHRHVRFTMGASTTATTALDTLADRRGVCRDFSHLTIALCRAVNIPARFVTGIDYGADPALGPCDFHAYVEAWVGDRWWLFDSTGISPVTGLVRLGTGRDAADVAFATVYGSVRTFAPRVSVRAVDDAAQGFTQPAHSPYAVSTAALDFCRAPDIHSADERAGAPLQREAAQPPSICDGADGASSTASTTPRSMPSASAAARAPGAASLRPPGPGASERALPLPLLLAARSLLRH